MLEVGCDFHVSRHPGDTCRADALVGAVPRWGWEQRCQGPGAKGLRTHAWAWVALDPAGCPDGWARSLLIRRDPDADDQYAYFSSFSSSWLDHARRYTEDMTRRFGLNARSRVVELASNDGYLLQHFLPLGVPVLGIEPAPNVAGKAEAIGVPTLVEFFGREHVLFFIAEVLFQIVPIFYEEIEAALIQVYGPDARGRVLTTIFAATTSGRPGGYGVANAVVADALAAARSSGPVSSGACAG